MLSVILIAKEIFTTTAGTKQTRGRKDLQRRQKIESEVLEIWMAIREATQRS